MNVIHHEAHGRAGNQKTPGQATKVLLLGKNYIYKPGAGFQALQERCIQSGASHQCCVDSFQTGVCHQGSQFTFSRILNKNQLIKTYIDKPGQATKVVLIQNKEGK